jgi:hypothetical protein
MLVIHTWLRLQLLAKSARTQAVTIDKGAGNTVINNEGKLADGPGNNHNKQENQENTKADAEAKVTDNWQAPLQPQHIQNHNIKWQGGALHWLLQNLRELLQHAQTEHQPCLS